MAFERLIVLSFVFTDLTDYDHKQLITLYALCGPESSATSQAETNGQGTYHLKP